MQNVLHLPEDKEKIRSDFLSAYNKINKENESYRLSTANALWAQEGYSFEKDYFKLINDYYKGKVTNLDFSKNTEKSRTTINTWVEDKTNDKIKDLISKGELRPDTRLVLTNAIYFNADWVNKFDTANTREGDFKLSSGELTNAEMMWQKDRFDYGETKDIQILEMDYLGGDLSMLVLLPKENDLAGLEDSLSIANLEDWRKDMAREEVKVTLPKFKLEAKYSMEEDLKEMGMPTAFDSMLADFTGMHAAGNLFISKVIHQTFIDVTESGTEAAAATAVLMVESIAVRNPVQPKEFTADHPFIFLIQEKDTGNILFMGKIADPSRI
jgi:serpin B